MKPVFATEQMALSNDGLLELGQSELVVSSLGGILVLNTVLQHILDIFYRCCALMLMLALNVYQI